MALLPLMSIQGLGCIMALLSLLRLWYGKALLSFRSVLSLMSLLRFRHRKPLLGLLRLRYCHPLLGLLRLWRALSLLCPCTLRNGLPPGCGNTGPGSKHEIDVGKLYAGLNERLHTNSSRSVDAPSGLLSTLNVGNQAPERSSYFRIAILTDRLAISGDLIITYLDDP